MKKAFKFLLPLAALLLLSSSASAETIMKYDLGGTGPDVQLVGNVFSTINDGFSGTPGQQNTALDFTGFLDSTFSDILAGASMTISNVQTIGNALVVLNNGIVQQNTTGGTVSFWNASGALLLSGSLASGSISGTLDGSTGSFFNTTAMTFTGGSLLPYLSPTSGGFSLALSNIFTGGFSGFDIVSPTAGLSRLGNFTADAGGLISGTSVPEPTSMFLLGSAILGGIARRKKELA